MINCAESSPGRPKKRDRWSICPHCGQLTRIDAADQIGVKCAACGRRFASPYVPQGLKWEGPPRAKKP